MIERKKSLAVAWTRRASAVDDPVAGAVVVTEEVTAVLGRDFAVAEVEGERDVATDVGVDVERAEASSDECAADLDLAEIGIFE